MVRRQATASPRPTWTDPARRRDACAESRHIEVCLTESVATNLGRARVLALSADPGKMARLILRKAGQTQYACAGSVPNPLRIGTVAAGTGSPAARRVTAHLPGPTS